MFFIISFQVDVKKMNADGTVEQEKNSITKNTYLNMNGYTFIAAHELNIPGKIRILLCSYSFKRNST